MFYRYAITNLPKIIRRMDRIIRMRVPINTEHWQAANCKGSIIFATCIMYRLKV